MITYQHTMQLCVPGGMLAEIDIEAEIIADEYQLDEWTVALIRVEAIVDTVDQYGQPDNALKYLPVPDTHPLHDIMLRDLLDNCTSDINEAWGHYLDETRGDARSNAAENKLSAMAAE